MFGNPYVLVLACMKSQKTISVSIKHKCSSFVDNYYYTSAVNVYINTFTFVGFVRMKMDGKLEITGHFLSRSLFQVVNYSPGLNYSITFIPLFYVLFSVRQESLHIFLIGARSSMTTLKMVTPTQPISAQYLCALYPINCLKLCKEAGALKHWEIVG